jgi:dihydropyrimidine dehydrogenase (NAD+) subunit PreA
MDLSVEYLGLRFENPFLLASAPPTANKEMIARAFKAGWAGAVTKTLIREPVKNVTNRFGSTKAGGKVIAFENIELASERTPDEWFSDIRFLKEKFPQKRLIGSIMGDAKSAKEWLELSLGCQEAGVDLLELNFSCPHGYSEKGKGAAIGQHAEYSAQIVAWLKADKRITVPLIPKLTAAVADISYIGEAVANAGAQGICAINSFPALLGFDLLTLKPKASVRGYSAVAGYSGVGLKPIALRAVSNLVKNPGLPVMACGGISSGFDAAEFLLMGAPLVQVCTAVMLEGYGLIRKMTRDLSEFMAWHEFTRIQDFLGRGNQMIRQYAELDTSYAVKAQVDAKKCTGCRKCVVACRDSAYQAIAMQDKVAVVDQSQCTGCSLCFQVCPHEAVQMVEV